MFSWQWNPLLHSSVGLIIAFLAYGYSAVGELHELPKPKRMVPRNKQVNYGFQGGEGQLTAGDLVIFGGAVDERVAAELLVDAAASLAFVIPFVATRRNGGCCNKGY